MLGLIDERRVLPHHRLTTHKLNGQWITAAQFTTSYQEKHRSEATQFQPPPRPPEVEERTTGFIDKPATPDATQSLFEALQAVRDRQNTERERLLSGGQTGAQKDWGVSTRQQARVPAQIWLIGTLAALLLIGVWGVLHILSKQAELSTASPQAAAITQVKPQGATESQAAPPSAPSLEHRRPNQPARRVVAPNRARDDRDRRDERDEQDERERRERDELEERERAERDRDRYAEQYQEDRYRDPRDHRDPRAIDQYRQEPVPYPEQGNVNDKEAPAHPPDSPYIGESID